MPAAAHPSLVRRACIRCQCLTSLLFLPSFGRYTCAGPSEFTVPGFALRSGFAGAVLYYLLVLEWHWLSAEEGRGLIVLLYVIHGVISDLAGKRFD